MFFSFVFGYGNVCLWSWHERKIKITGDKKKINHKIYIFIIFSHQSATEEDADENEKEIVDIVMKKMVS